MNSTYEGLLKIVPQNNIFLNEPMSKHTSFKIGGNADYFIKVQTEEQLKSILEFSKKENIPLTIIGNGSNLLVLDSGIKGITLKIDIKNINVDINEQNAAIIVGAGYSVSLISKMAIEYGLGNLEFLSGIPATIGGAIRMNAGAFGNEMKDIVSEVKYIDKNGKINVLKNEEINFSYRNSIFEENKEWIIVECKIVVPLKNKEEVKKRIEEISEARREKQPIEYPSAGSTFKRGEDFITAKLIDDAGLKGMRIGDAEVSTKHAGFIVNKGNATASDVLKLVEHIKKVIKEKFNKNIELEILVIGEE